MPGTRDFSDFVELLSWRAQAHPERVVFRYYPDGEQESAALSFGELVTQARMLAAELQARRLTGQAVLLLYPPGLDFITAFIGCLFAGVMPVPAYPPEPHRIGHTLQRIQSIIRDARATAVLTDSLILGMARQLMQQSSLPGLERLQWLESDALIRGGSGENWQKPALGPQDLAFLQYTSGSTSQPKGVMISHRNLLVDLAMLHEGMGQREGQPKTVCWVPFYHDMGLIGHLLYPLFCGGQTLLMPPLAFLKKPARWLRLVSDTGATITSGPNFAYDLCVRKMSPAERAGLDLSRVEHFINAAEPINADTLARFRSAFEPYGYRPGSMAPAYGLAETVVFISFCRSALRPRVLSLDPQALTAGRAVDAAPDISEPRRIVGCGQTRLGAKLLIVDPESHLPLNERRVGEIWVQGEHVAQGYWNQPEATAESFGATVNGHEGNWLRTGDLGFVEQGEVFVTGRLKDLIIVRGRNLYPHDLERSLDQLRLPELRKGCGVAFSPLGPSSGSESGEAVVIFQEVLPEASPTGFDPEDLSRRIAAAIAAEHQLPVQAVALLKAGTLPKTSSGKLMRQACRQAYAKGLSASPIEPVYLWRAESGPALAAQPPAPLAAETPAAPSSAQRPSAWLSWLQAWLHGHVSSGSAAFGLDTRFQALGLDSLLAVRLVADLEQATGASYPETLLWEYSTPRALLHYLDHQARPSQAEPQDSTETAQPMSEAIAVIGMSCRFPGGAESPGAFWDLLVNGRDAIGPIPPSRWPLESYYDPEPGKPGKMYVAEGGYLTDVSGFEPGFFQISPREAERMDPQQRLLLELAWEALEHAGLAAPALQESATGVFVGLSNIDYGWRNLHPAEQINAYSGTGNTPSVAAGRLAYWLGLQGPTLSIDTACSSSLVAVHQACNSLRLGECDLALAGGVNLILSPEGNVYFCQLQALASDSRCKSFDDAANGFIRSEGGGLVVLKRLSAAQRDGDKILGVIRGSAVNHDGPSNGLTAPNGLAQQKVIRRALQQAGTAPEAISFVETHGTGTALGDPIEARALQEILLVPQRSTPLTLGALKSQIGHSESAAGVAGLIKTLLALQHRTLPPNLHFHQLNSRIPPDPRLSFPTSATPWTGPRLAGISSFGISGTNAHLILAEAEPPVSQLDATAGPWLFVLSAHSQPALISRLKQLADWLEAHADASLADLAFTLAQRRSRLRHRRAVFARDGQELIQALRAAAQACRQDDQLPAPPERPGLAFVFSGQGAQWVGMGRELMLSEPVFNEAILLCEAAFAGEVDWKLSEVLATAHDTDFAQMDLLQPVLFAMQVALTALWQAWGIRPDIVIGHSMGEVAAAYVAGALSLSDAAKVICRRSRLLAQQASQSAGGMLYTALRPEACAAYLSDEVMIGVYNGPESTVLTGERQALDAIRARLEAEEIFCRFVQVPVAAHSRQIDAYAEPMQAALAGIEAMPPKSRMLSTVQAAALEQAPGPDYWFDNLRQPVRFAQSVELAMDEGIGAWLEISPHPLLLQSLQASARSRKQPSVTLASLRREQPELATLHQALLQLIAAGIEPRWEKFAPVHGQLLELPSYPWQRQPYWIEFSPTAQATPGRAPRQAQAKPAPPSPQAKVARPVIPQQLYQLRWEKSLPPDASPAASGSWLIFSEDEALDETLELLLKGRGQHCLFVRRNPETRLEKPPFGLDPLQPDHFAALIEALNRHLRQPLAGIVYGWRSAGPFSPEAAMADYTGLQHLLQQLEGLNAPAPRVFVLSRGAWQPEAESLSASVWWGLARSAFYEYPQFHLSQIDLGLMPDAHEHQLLAAELLAGSPETNVLLRGGERSVLRIAAYQPAGQAAPATPKPAPRSLREKLFGARPKPILVSAPASRLAISAEASYLLSGGLGELGIKTADWLIGQGARHLLLIGRSGASGEIQQNSLSRWQAQGVQVEVLSCDVADFAALQTGLSRARASLPPLKGVIHAAGVLRDGLIAHQLASANAEVFAPKIAGAWHLHRLTLSDPLDFFIGFSSITSALGMPGQANYAAANSFLDGLMQYRRSLGLPALSIAWGPWHRPAAVAQAAEAGHTAERLMLSQYGFGWLAPERGFELLETLLRDQAAAASVMSLDLGLMLESLPQTRNLPLLSLLAREQQLGLNLRRPGRARAQAATAPGPKPQSNQASDSSLVTLAAGATLPSADELEGFLVNAIARILNLPAAELNTQTSLRGFGFDSLMALELKARVQDAYGITLKANERFQSMTIGEMSQRLLESSQDVQPIEPKA